MATAVGRNHNGKHSAQLKGKEAEINRKNSEIQNLKSTIKTLSTLGKEENGGSGVVKKTGKRYRRSGNKELDIPFIKDRSTVSDYTNMT